MRQIQTCTYCGQQCECFTDGFESGEHSFEVLDLLREASRFLPHGPRDMQRDDVQAGWRIRDYLEAH